MAETHDLELPSAGEEETRSVGERLGKQLRKGDVVLLSGELGAGKTCLTQGIGRGLACNGQVNSPSFVLMNEYEGRETLYHVDLYRVSDPRDLTNLGWDEMLADDALVLIEWPEHAGDRLPRIHVPISLQHLPNDPGRRLLYAGGHV